MLFAFAPRRRSTADRHAVADRGGELLLEALGVDHLALAVADRPGDLEALHDVDQGAVVEGQRALAVGEASEGDEPEEIIRPAR